MDEWIKDEWIEECVFCGQPAEIEPSAVPGDAEVGCTCVQGWYGITRQAMRELKRSDVSEAERQKALNRIRTWVIERHECGEEVPVVKRAAFGFSAGHVLI